MPTTHVLAFTIFFEGLMTFVGTSPTRNVRMHVALVNSPDHKAVLCLPDGYEVSLSNNAVVTFSLGEGEAKPDDSFDDRVPNLVNYVEQGAFDEVVVKKGKREGVSAYVRLPNGELSACTSFFNPAVLTKKGGFADTRCLGRLVKFASTGPVVDDKVVITVTNGDASQTFCVAATDTIRIRNIPCHEQDKELHFHEYSRLLKAGGRVHRSHDGKGRCSPDGEIIDNPSVATNVAPVDCKDLDCDNQRAPRADCGPTDFP
jgi:hypothetical protein